ncbi:MAG: hypothetical protein J6S85_26100 [Methanobrevibacter sp.]|nr:hypothetical protein [Methanobrevibacter sp.]MBO7717065.1 hypothetical protein [Methanobrevibacter sp.]
MSYTGSNRRFGVTSNVSGLAAGIVVNSISHSDNTETAEARDEKGRVIDIAVYGGGDEISVDGLVVGEGVKAGSIVSIPENGVAKNYIVTTTSKNESNTAFQTASFNARYAPSCEYWSKELVESDYTWDASGYISGTVNSDDPNYTPGT